MSKATRRVTRNTISGRLRTITLTISPYANGLARETRNYVAVLNEEAARRKLGVTYEALSNKITVSGDLQGLSNSPDTLGCWTLRRAVANGYLEGEDAVLQKGNTAWRKALRRRDKTKAGMAEAVAIAKAEGSQKEYHRIVREGAGKLHDMIQAVPQGERLNLGIHLADFRRTLVPRPIGTNFPTGEKSRRKGRKPTSTTFRKGGPNPRRSRPDT